MSNTSSTHQSINTIISDTPAVSASTTAAGDTIATTPLTLELAASSTLTSYESVPSPISVSTTSHPSATYVHSSGPPPLIPFSTVTSTLPPHMPSLNLGVNNSPNLTRSNTTISPLMASSTTDHNHSPQKFAASRLPKLILPTFYGNPLAWLTFWDSFQAAIHLNPNLSGVQKFNYLKDTS